MFNEDESNYYDTLEVQPDATQRDIREAYLKLKATYAKENPALYTLIDNEDKSDLLRKIEEAYLVLSDSEKRAQYDRNFSVDRPSAITNFQNKETKSPPEPTPPEKEPAQNVQPPTHQPATTPAPAFKSRNSSAPQKPVEPSSPYSSIREWTGSLLQSAREQQSISVEEMADYTKISKRYIRAIESEDFDNLPAPVYLRGFLLQMAKKLSVDSDSVATSYMSRYRQSRPEDD